MKAPITTYMLMDVGGEKPAYCLMAAYRDQSDAVAAQNMLLRPPSLPMAELAKKLHHDANFIFDDTANVKDVIEWFYSSLMVEA